jgi:hypothetical protein
LLYDKKAETLNAKKHLADRVPDGTYRFEATMRNERLNSAGMARLAHVNEERVWAALSHRWEQTRWASPISSGGDLAEALADQIPDTALRLLGYLASRAHGDLVVIDRRKERDLAARCRELGLVPGLPLESLGKASMHLDLYLGRMVRDASS